MPRRRLSSISRLVVVVTKVLLAAGPRHTIISGLSKPRDWTHNGVELQAALPKRLAGFLGLVYHRGWLRFVGEPPLAAACA